MRNKDAKKVWRSWVPFLKSGRGIQENAPPQGNDQIECDSTIQGISVPAPQSEGSADDELPVLHSMEDGTFIEVAISMLQPVSGGKQISES